MRRSTLVLMRLQAVLVLGVVLSACGHSAKVKQEAGSQQAQQAEAKGRALAQECAFAGNKKAVTGCLQKHGVTQQCAEHASQGANFFSRAGRQRFVIKLEGCAR